MPYVRQLLKILWTDIIISFAVWINSNDWGIALLGLLGLIMLDFILGAIVVPFCPHTERKFSSQKLLLGTVLKIVYYAILISAFALIGIAIKPFVHNYYVQLIVDFATLGFIFAVIALFELGSILEHLVALGLDVKVFGRSLSDLLEVKWKQGMNLIQKEKTTNMYWWWQSEEGVEQNTQQFQEVEP